MAAVFHEHGHKHGLEDTIDWLQRIFRPVMLQTVYNILVAHNDKLVAMSLASDIDPSSATFVDYVSRLGEWSPKSGQRVEFRMLASEGARKGEKIVHQGEIWLGGLLVA